ncbi:MAG: DM13 domain-containing protein [Rubrivivax sp.]|nr:DM13 domain-containing protein [Rubrivivax sp.]
MVKTLVLVATHVLALAAGFALGVYTLPILIAPAAPTAAEVAAEVAAQPQERRFTGTFRRELKDSDALHWGEGTVTVGRRSVTLAGDLAPGPDYKLYLSPQFVETEADFVRLKPQMVRVGDVKTFRNFVVPVPDSVDPARYTTVIVWCESFGQFITAARYR